MRKLSRRISVIAGAAFLAATGEIAAGIGQVHQARIAHSGGQRSATRMGMSCRYPSR